MSSTRFTSPQVNLKLEKDLTILILVAAQTIDLAATLLIWAPSLNQPLWKAQK